MDFSFTAEADAFRQTVRRFAQERLAPRYQHHDREKSFPEAQLKECAELGLLGLRIPEVYGGTKAEATLSGIACERLPDRSAVHPSL